MIGSRRYRGRRSGDRRSSAGTVGGTASGRGTRIAGPPSSAGKSALPAVSERQRRPVLPVWPRTLARSVAVAAPALTTRHSTSVGRNSERRPVVPRPSPVCQPLPAHRRADEAAPGPRPAARAVRPPALRGAASRLLLSTPSSWRSPRASSGCGERRRSSSSCGPIRRARWCSARSRLSTICEAAPSNTRSRKPEVLSSRL